jgi:hypothetical protein
LEKRVSPAGGLTIPSIPRSLFVHRNSTRVDQARTKLCLG